MSWNEIFAKGLCVDNLEKLKDIFVYVDKLNDLFISFGFTGNEHLDVISTYLAFCLHKEVISHNQLNQMPVLIKELIEYFKLIESKKM